MTSFVNFVDTFPKGEGKIIQFNFVLKNFDSIKKM